MVHHTDADPDNVLIVDDAEATAKRRAAELCVE
jgi:hypothetical protein